MEQMIDKTFDTTRRFVFRCALFGLAVAIMGGRSPFDEIRWPAWGAAISEQPGFRVDFYLNDAFGRFEIVLWLAFKRRFHKIGPNFFGVARVWIGADRFAFIIADPYGGDQIGRKAGHPAVS